MVIIFYEDGDRLAAHQDRNLALVVISLCEDCYSWLLWRSKGAGGTRNGLHPRKKMATDWRRTRIEIWRFVATSPPNEDPVGRCPGGSRREQVLSRGKYICTHGSESAFVPVAHLSGDRWCSWRPSWDAGLSAFRAGGAPG